MLTINPCLYEPVIRTTSTRMGSSSSKPQAMRAQLGDINCRLNYVWTSTVTQLRPEKDDTKMAQRTLILWWDLRVPGWSTISSDASALGTLRSTLKKSCKGCLLSCGLCCIYMNVTVAVAFRAQYISGSRPDHINSVGSIKCIAERNRCKLCQCTYSFSDLWILWIVVVFVLHRPTLSCC